jgi:outer membrane protein assembly factor BamB
MNLRRTIWIPLGSIVALISSMLLVACEPFSQPNSQPVSTSLQTPMPDVVHTPLEHLTIYISDKKAIHALRANDGKERWQISTSDSPNVSTRVPPEERELPSSFTQIGGVLIYQGSASINAARTSDGHLLWKYPDYVHSFLATPSLVVYSSSIGQQNDNGFITALRASDGHLLWKYATTTASPLLITPSLVIYSHGTPGVMGQCTLGVLRASDGKQLWQKANCGQLTEANGILYEQFDTKLTAFQASTGQQLWQVNLDDASQSVTSQPPIVSNQIVYQTMSRSIYAVRASDGKRLWKFPVAFATVASSNKQIFIMSGNKLYALQANTGTKQWETTVGHDRGVRWLMTENDKVYAWTLHPTSDDIHLFHVLRAQDGKQLWQVTMVASSYGTKPVLSHGIIYTGDGRELFHAIRAQDAKEMWHFTIRDVYDKQFLLGA